MTTLKSNCLVTKPIVASQSLPAKLSIAFTSDEHGQIANAGKLQGEINRMRSQNPQGTLLVSCGDVFQGSAETDVLGTQASSEILKRAGYDYLAIGNHDFDFGRDQLKQWIAAAPCPVLNANIVDRDGQLLEGTVPSVIRDVDGHKVGLIGCTTPETATILSPTVLDGVQFLDPEKAVRREVERLKDQGAEVVGLLSHLGIEADRKLAESQPGVDFILGGHSHLAMKEKEVINNVLVVHGGSGRQTMGQLEVPLHSPNLAADSQFTLFNPTTTGSVEPEPVGQFVEQQEAIVDRAMGKVIAHLERPTIHEPDVLSDSMEALTGRACLERTGGDVYLINQKGIRSSLPAGDITMRDVFKVFPFDSALINLELTVDQVKGLYTESLRRMDQTSLTEETTGRFAIASDVKTHELQVLDSNGSSRPGNDLIKVTTSTYLQEGGLGYLEAGKEVVKDSFPTFREVLADYLDREQAA